MKTFVELLRATGPAGQAARSRFLGRWNAAIRAGLPHDALACGIVPDTSCRACRARLRAQRREERRV